MNTRVLPLVVMSLGLSGLGATPTAFAAASAFASAAVDTTAGPVISDNGTTAGALLSRSASDGRTVFIASGGGNVLQGDEIADARAAAGTGVLRVAARTGQGLQGGVAFAGGVTTGTLASAIARFTVDDLVVSALPGGPPAPAFTSVSLRFSVSGLMPDVTADGRVFDTATILAAPEAIFASASSELDMSVGLAVTGGSGLGTHSSRARLSTLTTNAVGAEQQAPLLLGGFAGQLFNLQSGNGFLVETGAITVPVDTALSLTVELRGLTRSNAFFPFAGGEFVSDAHIDFSHTVTFATDGVATLANGFTLNSLQAGIVDNQWTPVPVPIPSAAWMLMSGLAGFGWRIRRHDPSAFPRGAAAGLPSAG